MSVIGIFELLLGLSITDMPLLLQPVIYLAMFVFAFLVILLLFQAIMIPFKIFWR